MARKQALGRGLKALIPDTPRVRSGLAELPTDRIQPNPHQPRARFDPEALSSLAASLAEHGMLQPLLVSEDEDGRYLLIAGERRWRAAREAGLPTVPAVIRERLDERGELELALVENLQRRDLTPLEEARAYENLRVAFGLSQAQIAERVGFDRSSVANALRLLKLPAEIQELIEEGRLSASHARTLLAFADGEERMRWARRAADGNASVRELERAAAAARDRGQGSTQPAPRPKPKPDPNLRSAEDRLALHLGARVEIVRHRRGGRIVIHCANQDELLRVYDFLMGEQADDTES